MMKKFLSKTLVLLLAFLMVFSCLGTAVFAAPEEAESAPEQSETKKENASKLKEIEELLNSNTYEEYRLVHKDAPNGEGEIILAGKDFDESATTAKVFVDKYLGDEEVVLVSETGDVTWKFNAEKSGNYHIAITYAPVVEYDADGDGKIDDGEESLDLVSNTATIKRALLLDGAYPFKQSRYIELPRV